MNIEVRKNIKACLREHLLGKENVAKKDKIIKELNISESTIKSWTTLNDNKIPTADDLKDIANILGITLNQLYGIEDKNVIEAMKLKSAYDSHPEQQESVKKLLDIKEL